MSNLTERERLEAIEAYANQLYDRLVEICAAVRAGYDSDIALLLREGIPLLGRNQLGQRQDSEDER